MELAIGASFGGITTRCIDKKTKRVKVYARIGLVIKALGLNANDDPDAALALLEEFRDSAVWEYVTLANFPEKLGKWVADGKSRRAGRDRGQPAAAVDDAAAAEMMADVDEQLAAWAERKAPADGGFWAKALSELSRQMTRPTFNTWLKGTTGDLDGDTLVVIVPSIYCRDWLDKRLRSTVEGVVQELAGRAVACEFVVAPGAAAAGSEAA